MRVAIFGLGYVGCVSAGCLARLGHHVIGVDLNPGKVEALAAGESPIVEHGLPELLREMRDAGRLTATTEHAKAVAESDLSVICVGTPSADDGRLDLTHVQRVSGSIAEALRAAPGLPRRRPPLDGPSRHRGGGFPAGAPGRIKEGAGARFRGGLQPRVPARRERALRFRPPALYRRRRHRPAGGEGGARALRRDRGAASSPPGSAPPRCSST